MAGRERFNPVTERARRAIDTDRTHDTLIAAGIRMPQTVHAIQIRGNLLQYVRTVFHGSSESGLYWQDEIYSHEASRLKEMGVSVAEDGKSEVTRRKLIPRLTLKVE